MLPDEQRPQTMPLQLRMSELLPSDAWMWWPVRVGGLWHSIAFGASQAPGGSGQVCGKRSATSADSCCRDCATLAAVAEAGQSFPGGGACDNRGSVLQQRLDLLCGLGRSQRRVQFRAGEVSFHAENPQNDFLRSSWPVSAASSARSPPPHYHMTTPSTTALLSLPPPPGRLRTRIAMIVCQLHSGRLPAGSKASGGGLVCRLPSWL